MAKQEKESAATRIIKMVSDAGITLFRDADDKAYALVEVENSRRTMPLRGRAFGAWIKRLYFFRTQQTASSQAVADAVATMESLAMFQGEQCQVPVRVAAHKDEVYLDLANDAWEAVKIDAEGWSVKNRPPVNFHRPRALRQLPTPVQAPNSRIKELRKYVNVAETEWRLILAWTLFALTPDGPFPVLIFRGGQGSGKSSVRDS